MPLWRPEGAEKVGAGSALERRLRAGGDAQTGMRSALAASTSKDSSASDQSPWLSIPASDYEGHMGSARVGQLAVLNQILADTLAEFSPRSLAVIGCSTGNGFEHIDPSITHRVVGIDINPDYLRILEQRQAQRLNGLGLVCADLASCSIEPNSFDLIHAALIFEYISPEEVLPKLGGWLKPGGVLAVVLQLPSPTSTMVSETPYATLKALESIMRLVDPGAFRDLADGCGLTMLRSWEVELKQGKKFHAAYYKMIGKGYEDR